MLIVLFNRTNPRSAEAEWDHVIPKSKGSTENFDPRRVLAVDRLGEGPLCLQDVRALTIYSGFDHLDLRLAGDEDGCTF
jgi:hypothetical protein